MFRINPIGFVTLLLSSATCGTSRPPSAATFTSNGAVNDAWDVPQKGSSYGVLGESDDVVIGKSTPVGIKVQFGGSETHVNVTFNNADSTLASKFLASS